MDYDNMNLEELISELEDQVVKYDELDDISRIKNLKMYNQLVKDNKLCQERLQEQILKNSDSDKSLSVKSKPIKSNKELNIVLKNIENIKSHIEKTSDISLEELIEHKQQLRIYKDLIQKYKDKNTPEVKYENYTE